MGKKQRKSNDINERKKVREIVNVGGTRDRFCVEYSSDLLVSPSFRKDLFAPPQHTPTLLSQQTHSLRCTYTLTKHCKNTHNRNSSLPYTPLQHSLTHTYAHTFEKSGIAWSVCSPHCFLCVDRLTDSLTHTHTYTHSNRRQGKNYILSFDPKPFDFLRLGCIAT